MPSYYYLIKTDPTGAWSPVSGSWLSTADAIEQMSTVLTNNPGAQVGAYTWDGQSIGWRMLT